MLIIKNHAVFACAAVALLSFAVMVESVAFFIDDSRSGEYKLSESAAYSFFNKSIYLTILVILCQLRIKNTKNQLLFTRLLL